MYRTTLLNMDFLLIVTPCEGLKVSRLRVVHAVLFAPLHSLGVLYSCVITLENPFSLSIGISHRCRDSIISQSTRPSSYPCKRSMYSQNFDIRYSLENPKPYLCTFYFIYLELFQGYQGVSIVEGLLGGLDLSRANHRTSE